MFNLKENLFQRGFIFLNSFYRFSHLKKAFQLYLAKFGFNVISSQKEGEACFILKWLKKIYSVLLHYLFLFMTRFSQPPLPTLNSFSVRNFLPKEFHPHFYPFSLPNSLEARFFGVIPFIGATAWGMQNILHQVPKSPCSQLDAQGSVAQVVISSLF